MWSDDLRAIGHQTITERSFRDTAVLLRDFSWDAGQVVVHDNTMPEIHFRLHSDDPGTVLMSQSGEHFKLRRLCLTIPTPPSGLRHRTMSGFGYRPVQRKRFVSCRFNHSRLEELADSEIRWDQVSARALANFYNPRIEHMMRWIAEEVFSGPSQSESLLRSLCDSVGVEIGRCYGTRSRTNELDDIQAMIATVFELIDQSDVFPAPSEIVSRLNVKRSTLDRMLGNAGQGSLRALMEDRRMERAKQLLRETDAPLKSVSYQLGYAHQSAFTVAFSRCVGETPTEYRTLSRRSRSTVATSN